jgi:heme-degrading monooxygenase HmoA
VLGVISREWSCRCVQDDADRYEELLLTRILPELDGVEGCHGAYVFRRELADEVEFVVLHLFDSLAALRAFAGEDYETAVVPDKARALLTSFDHKARHFDVRTTPRGLTTG